MKNAVAGILGAALIWLATPAMATSTTNNVYIEQVGSGSTITITQQGLGNEVGNANTATTLSGNGQSVTISQIGSQNTHVVDVEGINSTVNSAVAGDNNAVTINCGASGTTACTDSNLTANATGNGNTLNLGMGTKSTGSIIANGDHNNLSIQSTTTNMMGATASISATGGGNTVSVSQSGTAGANGYTADVQVTGSSNNIGVTQSGTVDSNVSVHSTGSNNNITVTTGN